MTEPIMTTNILTADDIVVSLHEYAVLPTEEINEALQLRIDSLGDFDMDYTVMQPFDWSGGIGALFHYKEKETYRIAIVQGVESKISLNNYAEIVHELVEEQFNNMERIMIIDSENNKIVGFMESQDGATKE